MRLHGGSQLLLLVGLLGTRHSGDWLLLFRQVALTVCVKATESAESGCGQVQLLECWVEWCESFQAVFV